jgi:hypothetical protein
MKALKSLLTVLFMVALSLAVGILALFAVQLMGGTRFVFP